MSTAPLPLRCHVVSLFVPAAIALALAACGGSDDDAGSGGTAGSGTLTLTGIAATGAALVGARVDARCATGSGTDTTVGDGSYTIKIEGGVLPCALSVTPAGSGGSVLHSAAVGSGSSARANLTPATELVLARLLGKSPAAAQEAFDAAPLTAEGLAAAVAAVKGLLAAGGIDYGPDPVAGALAVGDAADQALDALARNLGASGTTLAQAVDALLVAGGAAPVGTPPALPPAQLFAAAAPNCAALRSGKYRLVFFAPGDGGSVFTDTMTLDAPTLKLTLADGEADTLVANGGCQYTANGAELVVSPAGIVVLRSSERPGFVAGMAIPVQQHAVSATTGLWNYLGLGDTDDTGGAPTLFGGEMTVDAAGKVTADIFCDDINSCVAETPDARMAFTANAGGGFDFDGGRAFAYRAGGGELMIAFVGGDGSFALATRKAPRTLPAVGSVNRTWNLTVTPQYTSPFALSSSESTTVSHAGDGMSYVRNAVVDFSTGVTRPETVQINTPREGFFHRVPQTVTTSSGGSSVVGEWVALQLRGIGITPVGIVSNNQLVLSVVKPTPQ